MSIEDAIRAAAKKRVLFIGEEIEDVYHYGKLQGRPLKEAIICIEYQHTEAFQGGVIAAARHAETLCAVVHRASARRIRKERYVEEAHTRKLFEVYSGNEALPFPLLIGIEDYDAVIVTDFGHGMMTPKMVEQVCHQARFLAVNVQTNSGNYGYNLATKYPRCDYLCVDEPEARLATQNRDGAIERSLEELSRIAPRVAITLGRNGAIGSGDIRCKAFTERVVDTMGAGDAFFAVTAPLAAEASMDDLLRIGNAAGALKSQIVGHRKAVNKNDLVAFLRTH
jgi:bifunctional ADP-heptose synthase (sugar kinase/adenylyltransferase)